MPDPAKILSNEQRFLHCTRAVLWGVGWPLAIYLVLAYVSSQAETTWSVATNGLRLLAIAAGATLYFVYTGYGLRLWQRSIDARRQRRAELLAHTQAQLEQQALRDWSTTCSDEEAKNN